MKSNKTKNQQFSTWHPRPTHDPLCSKGPCQQHLSFSVIHSPQLISWLLLILYGDPMGIVISKILESLQLSFIFIDSLSYTLQGLWEKHSLSPTIPSIPGFHSTGENLHQRGLLAPHRDKLQLCCIIPSCLQNQHPLRDPHTTKFGCHHEMAPSGS